MRILFLTPTYLPNQGGVEIFLSDLAVWFNSQGQDIKIIAQKYPRRLTTREVINGVEVFRCLFFDPKPPALKLKSIAAYIYAFILFPFNFFKFLWTMDRFNPDVINYHFPGAANYFLLLYLRFRKVKLIVSLHGSDVRELPYESSISRRLLKKTLKRADFIIANSKYILKEGNLIESSITAKSTVIYNGIDKKNFNSQEAHKQQGKYIFAMGRFIEKKGFDILIKAFGEVAQHNDNISLIIAGDGPRRSGLKRLVGDLGLRDKIKLLAWSDRGQIVKYLKGCEFFVLPSRYEAFGMAVIESLSAGKPVIAAACGGPEEIIKNGINGILVEKENSRALAGAIRELLTNRKLFTDLIEGARNSIGGFGIEKTGQEYLTIFRRCE